MNQAIPSQALPPGARPYRRSVRNVIIHKEMQREFTFVIITLLMVTMLGVGFVIHETIHQAAQGEGLQFGKINPFEILSEVKYQLLLKVSSILFATLVLLGGYSILFLHRIAGPVYRFRTLLSRLCQGEIPGVFKLREGDFFTETAEIFNRLLDQLRAEQARNRQLKDKINEILSAKPDPSLQKSVEEMKKLLEG